MKKILFLFFIIFIFIILSFSYTFARSCPLFPQHAYKTAKSSAVYYITETCTKRAFTKPNIFFTYFDSWSDVKIISSKILSSVPDDKLGFMPLKSKDNPKYETGEKDFNMLVFVDENSYTITDQQLSDYFNKASHLLNERAKTNIKIATGGIFRLKLANDVQNIKESIGPVLVANSDITKKADGLVVFTHADKTARTFGGYTINISLGQPPYNISGYCNHFLKNGGYDGDKRIIASVIDWGHKYASCGYDENEKHISDVSVGGECRNKPDTPCVQKNGYYMCNNTTDSYYASDPSIFTISSIIHEIMHYFGDHGNNDHYGTATCKTHSVPKKEFSCSLSIPGISPIVSESECYFGICPYVYENLKNATNNCP